MRSTPLLTYLLTYKFEDHKDKEVYDYDDEISDVNAMNFSNEEVKNYLLFTYLYWLIRFYWSLRSNVFWKPDFFVISNRVKRKKFPNQKLYKWKVLHLMRGFSQQGKTSLKFWRTLD